MIYNIIIRIFACSITVIIITGIITTSIIISVVLLVVVAAVRNGSSPATEHVSLSRQ